MSSSANIPGDVGLDDFYDAAPLEPHLLYQGEILIDVPILTMPKQTRWLLLKSKPDQRVEPGNWVKVLDSNQTKEQWDASNHGDFAVALLDKNPVLVLNQTCSVQSNDHLQVAPIFPAEAENEDLEKLKNGEIFSAFWLKQHPPEIMKDSYADLELMQAVHKSYIRRIRQQQHFRLNSERTRMLEGALTRYFGRPNSFDSRSDVVARTGTYLCVKCFHQNGRATPTAEPLQEGSKFQPCSVCGGTQWTLKGS